MYCPQCATANLENASFCRGCGANISLVSQALTGNLPAANVEERARDDDSAGGERGRRKDHPNIEKAIKNVFMGFAFVLVAFGARFFAPGGPRWWFWLLIPAFAMLGGGCAELVRLKMSKKSALPAPPRSAALPATPERAGLPRGRNTGELIPQPNSVAEGTTRHLEGEMPTSRLERPSESRPK